MSMVEEKNYDVISASKTTVYLLKVFVVISFFIALLSFIFGTVTGDIKVFLAGAHQADFLNGNWVEKSYGEWELKSVFSRLLTFVIYKLSLIFATYPSYELESMVSAFYALWVMIIIGSAVRICHIDGLVKNVLVFSLLGLCIFAIDISCRMQTEMSCVVLLVLSFALAIRALDEDNNKRKILFFIAGMIFGSIFYFKSVFILMLGSYISALILKEYYDSSKMIFSDYMMLAGGILAILLLGAGSILRIYPQEFQHILHASIYQDTLLHTTTFKLGIVKSFVYKYLDAMRNIPCVFVGTLLLIYNIGSCKYNSRFYAICLHISLWFFPTIIIFLGNKFFWYHYALFIAPAIIECICYWVTQKNALQWNCFKQLMLLIILGTLLVQCFPGVLHHMVYRKIYALLCILLCIGMMLSVKCRNLISIAPKLVVASLLFGIFYYLNYQSIFSYNVQCYIDMSKESYQRNEMLSIDNQCSVLYLDAGPGAYMLTNKSYLDYYYPLPLQRIREDSVDANRDFYKELLEYTMAYNGKYVTVDENWFFSEGNNSKIHKKLMSEYKKEKDFFFWAYRWNPFVAPSMDELIKISLYEKINL